MDVNFKPIRHMSDDEMSNDVFDEAHINPKFRGYPAGAEKLEKEYKSLRTQFTITMGKFRKSGMGDGWAGTEDERVHLTNTVYSCNFRDFCYGKPLVLYMYELLLPFDLLESAGGDMPAASTSSSSAPPRSTSTPTPSSSSTRSSKKRNDKFAPLVAAMRQPLAIAQSASTLRVEFYNAERLKFKVARERLAMARCAACVL